MTRGVVLIAAHHPYYGNLAYQLAVSIKCNAPDINISIITEGRGIAHLQSAGRKLAIFDKIIVCPEEYYTVKSTNKRDVFKIKTALYDLSPYDETIYFDADMLWLPKKNVNDLMDSFAEVDFTMSNRGCMKILDAKQGFIQWADPQHIKAIYKFNDELIYNLSSEFIYFKKKKAIKSLFAKAMKCFDFQKISHLMFAGGQPDELSFTIAMMQTGVYPHQNGYYPAYWEQYQKKGLSRKDMYDNYYLASFGGSYQDKSTISFYNDLAKAYCRKIGETIIPLESKREILSERSKI
jgi:hypothetical protein